MAAVAFDHDRAQAVGAGKRVDRREQALDEIAVIGIVDLGAIENDARHPARIDAPQNRTGGILWRHYALLIPSHVPSGMVLRSMRAGGTTFNPDPRRPFRRCDARGRRAR